MHHKPTVPRGSRICPVARRGVPECFCYNISSRTVEAAIRYCLGGYRECAVFHQLVSRGEVAPEDRDDGGSRVRPSPPRDGDGRERP